MDVITIESSAFQQILDSINEIKKILSNKSAVSPLSEKWLDISEVCILLKISKRTLQGYRDNGILPYSQINGKIYFRVSDIEAHLHSHYVKAHRTRA
jgi:hypothetical protein